MDVDWGAVPAYFGGIALAFTAATIWRDRKQGERDQAQHVAAWLEKRDDVTRLLVRNASDLPVFHVYVESAVGDLSHNRAQIGPDREEDFGYKTGVVSIDQPPRMTFTDAAGRRWRRTEDGNLKRARS